MTAERSTGAGQPALVARPGVNALLDGAAARHVCVVIGAAGWGKTTAVAAWTANRPTAWLRYDDHEADSTRLVGSLVEELRNHVRAPAPEVAGPVGRGPGVVAVCDWLRRSLDHDVVLVIDDLQGLAADSEAAGVVEYVCWQSPERLHVVLLSRREVPFSLARWRGRGKVAEIDAPQLAFQPAEIEALLRSSVGVDPPGLAARMRQCTAGWPVALHAAVEMVRGVGADQRLGILDHLTSPGERFHGYLTEEVLGSEPRRVLDALCRLAVFGEITSSATGIPASMADAEDLLVELTRRGLVRRTGAGTLRWSLMPPLADYFAHEAVLSSRRRVELHLRAGQECTRLGAHADALRHLTAAGEHSACAALLVEHGNALVDSGHGDAVLDAAGLPAEYLDDPRIQQVVGEARQAVGHWAEAMESFHRANQGQDELDPALAWRIGLIEFTQGEFPKVLQLLDRTRLNDEDTEDETRALTLLATTYRMVGDLERVEKVMVRAVAAAERCGTPRARSAVHQVLAMLAVAEADHREANVQCVNALHSAQAVDDLLQVGWIRVFHAFHVLEMGSPREAVTEAEIALGTTERATCPFLTAHALTTRARAHVCLGNLTEAQADFTTAMEIFQRLGSRFLAWVLCGLGDLQRIRGQLVRARAAYEEALALGEPSGDAFAIGHSLIGLARIRAADDLIAAQALADRAVSLREGLQRIPAVLTGGWVALLGGDRRAAVAAAARAAADARLRRDGPGLAEAIVLGVLSSADPTDAAGLLDEAIGIWHDSGCRLEEAAARVVAGRVGTAGSDIDVRLATATLRDAGVDVDARRAAGPLAVLRPYGPSVFIRTLGVFQVVRDGIPVSKTAWQSRKARDLLKILVAHRRPVPREQLMELLWPDADPVKAGNRLSVQLSMVRDVLQPDQEDGEPLVSDGSAVWLDPSRVRVDVEDFLANAEAALEAHRTGRSDATARLAATAAEYTGDFLEEDPYQEWAPSLAEEVRATHIALLRVLASRLREVGDVDGAVRYILRLLGQDCYDEQAHLTLVGVLLDAGRIGEARRHYRTYVRRMKEMGVVARPMPITGRTR